MCLVHACDNYNTDEVKFIQSSCLGINIDITYLHRNSAMGNVCYVTVRLKETGPAYCVKIPVKQGQILELSHEVF